jgi:hypothetical protein
LTSTVEVVQDVIDEPIGRVEQPGGGSRVVSALERAALERIIKTLRTAAVLVVEREGTSLRVIRYNIEIKVVGEKRERMLPIDAD